MSKSSKIDPKLKEGVKFDSDKIRWDLVPFDAINELAKVLTLGAIKYSARNWEHGMAWSRAYGALMRHMTSWFSGQDKDPETNLSHLSHAMCCISFLMAWELRSVGNDDRPKLSKEQVDLLSKLEIPKEFLKYMDK